MKKLKYDQVPVEFDEQIGTVDSRCTYPKCGCPHFMC